MFFLSAHVCATVCAEIGKAASRDMRLEGRKRQAAVGALEDCATLTERWVQYGLRPHFSCIPPPANTACDLCLARRMTKGTDA